MENEEQKPVDETPEQNQEVPEVPEVKQDRPEANYKAEIERHRADKERLRQELEAERAKQVKRYDPNDITTWGDTELIALKNSQDPNLLRYKQEAEDLLFERKMNKVLERERMNQKRASAEMTLRTTYPEALDPSSEFAAKMEQVMFDYDLQKSPAGRLAAAKIVAAEYQKGNGKANAAGRKQEEARLKDVKQTLSEGDRPDPRPNIPSNNKKDDELLNRINNPKARHEDVGAAMGDLLKKKGIDFNKMFGR